MIRRSDVAATVVATFLNEAALDRGLRQRL
jgi:hypothetical protein